MSTQGKSYFGQTVFLLIIATLFFLAIKQVLPNRLFSDEKPATGENIIVDSMAIMASELADVETAGVDSVNTVNAINAVSATDSIAIEEGFDPTISLDGYSNLKTFYAKLHSLEKDSLRKVRIGYYGDSMIEGDLIVQDLRSTYQNKYGGEGVGFVSIAAVSAGMRGSISHQYSKTWQMQSFVNVKKPKSAFGIDGQVFYTQGGADWVKYKAQKQRHSLALNNPTLFYGKSDNEGASISVHLGKGEAIKEDLKPSSLLNTLKVSGTTNDALQVTFNSTSNIPFYGFNFDNGRGVHVDNFSARGNSGLPLSVLNPSLMNAFDKELKYDLIILHYGANVLGYGSTNYKWYEKSMTKVVENIRQCFPNADILIISTADRSLKTDGVMQTDKAVVPLMQSQKAYARINRCGFINLYNLMGSNGSMVKWVENKDAQKDYTHFNYSGAKKVAKLVYDELNRGYDKYKTEN